MSEVVVGGEYELVVTNHAGLYRYRMGDVVRGGLLLLVYGLGMTAPFIVAALFSGPFLRWSARNIALSKSASRTFTAFSGANIPALSTATWPSSIG